MLIKWEQHAYNIAYSAATGVSFDLYHDVCPVCNGTGLLPHPTAYMGVAPCYVCRHGLISKGTDIELKKQANFDRRESCNVGTKTLSA